MPSITHARTRVFGADAKEFVLIYVPASQDVTHVFESNLDWTTPSGKVLTVVRKGTIYVRRAGSNQILTSVDFEQLVQRRIQRFREKILDRVTRVVKAAPEHETVTIAKVVGSTGEPGVHVVDAPSSSGLAYTSLKLSLGLPNNLAATSAGHNVSDDFAGLEFTGVKRDV